MLTQYLDETRRLLQNPPAPVTLFSDADLTAFINTSRGILAGEVECIRVLGTLALSAPTRSYALSAADIGVSATTGINTPFKANQATVDVGDGEMPLMSKPWAWFQSYLLGEVIPTEGQPTTWAQLKQGIAATLYFYPLPDTTFTVNLDCVCEPIDLTDNNTVEAIPYPFTDAVPFLAAYYAYMSVQRQDHADTMMTRYRDELTKGRATSTPAVLPTNYSQIPDPTIINKLGLPSNRGGQ
ncbi:hypothetical protein LCGC14_3043820 [marine sediment metagenome]|uniref:Uncharacterized protein n=1 Tax=marine sediment metagenome TaxID=412755 RepID=A0A0F8YWR5_9ZZZZ